MASAKSNRDVKSDLLKSIVAYAATGILGAAVAYGITALGRMPSRALTILPAGIHVIEGPAVTCEDTEFIAARVNPYVDPEVKTPPCGVLLTKAQAADLVQGLEAASQFYQSERIHYFQLARTRLAAIAKAPPQPDQKLKDAVLSSIGDLQYISEAAPRTLDGASLLPWAVTRIDTVLTDVSAEFDHIKSTLAGLKGAGVEAKHTEFYFVATNASDVEFYVSTSCTLRNNDLTARLVLEKVDRDDILSSALVYVPLLPGRGKLLKYTPTEEREVAKLLSLKGTVSLTCTLASGKAIETKAFDPAPFLVKESTFANK